MDGCQSEINVPSIGLIELNCVKIIGSHQNNVCIIDYIRSWKVFNYSLLRVFAIYMYTFSYA